MKGSDLMPASTDMAKNLVSISQFDEGQSSHIFERLQNEDRLIVLEDNQPVAVILSPQEYDRLTEIEEDYILLSEAYERLQKNEDQPGIPLADVMANHGITQEELDEMEDVAID